MPRTGRSASPGRPWTSTRRWPTGWASTGSRPSWRTCPSATSTRRSTRSWSSELAVQRPGAAAVHRSRWRSILRRLMDDNDIPCEVSGRPKNLWGIYAKMRRTARDLEQIHDVVAFRVITERHPRLLRGAGGGPRELHPDPGAVQRLRGDAQAQPVPVAAHLGDRAARRADGGPDPHRGDAPHRRGGHRRALGLQGGAERAVHRRPEEVRLAAPAGGVPAGPARTRPSSSTR